jgi:ribosomal protein S18 acetylase RimI-like enzyme
MIIRRATHEDLPRLLALERQAPSAAHWGEQHYRALFANAELSPASGEISPAVPVKRICLVVEAASNHESDERGAGFFADGFLVAQSVGDQWEIENLVVDVNCRRRGLASLLLGEVLRLAETTGGESIALEVRESNQAARALYAKWGFREAGRRRDYYRDPAEAALLLIFTCRTSEMR